MSLVFKPKIATVFEGSKIEAKKEVVQRRKQAYSKADLQLVVDLRAHGFSYLFIGNLLKRGQGGIANCIVQHDLYVAIQTKRSEILKGILA